MINQEAVGKMLRMPRGCEEAGISQDALEGGINRANQKMRRVVAKPKPESGRDKSEGK